MITPRARDAGSLPVAMLVTIVGLMLSTLLVNTVLQQATTTKTEVARVAALSAAQTGFDVGLAHIRAANNGGGSGVLRSLPCGTLAGTLATVTAATQASYAVTIAYYPTDPQNRTASWLLANPIICLPGGGAFSTPAYALLTSKGTYLTAAGTTASRTLHATYTFSTTTLNIPGGLIHEYRTSTSAPDLCWDAGSGWPTAGTPVQLQPCTSGSVRQIWSYNANLTVSLVSSKASSQPLGMCIDADTGHAIGHVVYLRACSATTIAQQQWSYNDNSNWEGTDNGSTLDGYCMNAQTPSTTGSFLILGAHSAGTCYLDGYDATQNFLPDTTVGAGAAGPSAGQLVNLKQFGRCLDVTDWWVGSEFLIAWPCKQAPDPANVGWNEKWVLPTIPLGATGVTALITTNNGYGLYCLRSPRSVASAQYVVVTGCTSTSANAEFKWTFYGNTGTYATSYTIIDTDGHCLSTTDPDAANPDLHVHGTKVTKIVVAVCNGSTVQKWNAPPNVFSALPLKDISEK